MESLRYFQPPCLSGLNQYSFKGQNCLKNCYCRLSPPRIWFTGLEETTKRSPQISLWKLKAWFFFFMLDKDHKPNDLFLLRVYFFSPLPLCPTPTLLISRMSVYIAQWQLTGKHICSHTAFITAPFYDLNVRRQPLFLCLVSSWKELCPAEFYVERAKIKMFNTDPFEISLTCW